MVSELPDFCDVAIVGGGPAGLAAATELKRAGVNSVIVLDREHEAGGIPRHCGHYPFGMREFHRLLRGPDYAARLVAQARDAGVVIATSTTVTRLDAGPVLELTTPCGLRKLAARKILLATGVREKSRATRLIGGTKPGGVISTGALQSLVYLKQIKPFARPVILGTELVSFSAIMTCRHLGIHPVAMVEPGARITARHPSDLLPRLLGIPLHLETEIAGIFGNEHVNKVVLRHSSGETREVKADGVIISGQFLPEATLVGASHLKLDPHSGGPVIDQFGHCSDPDFYAAGNLLRAVETAGFSWSEGYAVASTILSDLNGAPCASQTSRRIELSGDALKYVVPQRYTVSPIQAGVAKDFQLRVKRKVQGRLVMTSDGREIWSRAIRALPERRIIVPHDIVPQNAPGPLRFTLVEAVQ